MAGVFFSYLVGLTKKLAEKYEIYILFWDERSDPGGLMNPILTGVSI